MAKINQVSPQAQATPEVAKKALTPDEQKKLEAKRAERKAARQRVIEAIKKINDPKLAADVMLFLGKEQGPRRAPTASVNFALREALLKAGAAGLSELDVFRQFHIGQPEMVTKVRILVLTPSKKDRVWVKYFEPEAGKEFGVYRVVGVGENPPKDWDGYVPAEKEQL
jgi:hypothetical protein